MRWALPPLQREVKANLPRFSTKTKVRAPHTPPCGHSAAVAWSSATQLASPQAAPDGWPRM